MDGATFSWGVTFLALFRNNFKTENSGFIYVTLVTIIVKKVLFLKNVV
jgi:hypothetical protein